jgi:hypothetical protein
MQIGRQHAHAAELADQRIFQLVFRNLYPRIHRRRFNHLGGDGRAFIMSNIPTPDMPNPAVSLPPAAADAEHRARSDRRKQPTSVWDAFRRGGRRTRNRRAAEHKLPYFVDRFLPSVLLLIVLLLIASLTDAILTLRLLDAGGVEANPVMQCLLNFGVQPFLLGKYFLTVIGLPLLLIYQHHYLFGTRIRVGYLIPFTLVLYGVLIVYQFVLISHYAPW